VSCEKTAFKVFSSQSYGDIEMELEDGEENAREQTEGSQDSQIPDW
jgi:hypothetical protein